MRVPLLIWNLRRTSTGMTILPLALTVAYSITMSYIIGGIPRKYSQPELLPNLDYFLVAAT